jgi:BolA protein
MTLETRIRSRLDEALAPLHLQLVNESHNHSVAPGSETHWNLVIVSEAFAGKRLLQRHRAVYGALGTELREGIHALTMKTLAPDEWQGADVANPAPPCMGGSKADA